MIMKHDNKRESNPKLRFPEFRAAPQWREKSLNEALSSVVREREKPVEPYTGLGVRSHGKGTFLKSLENPEKNSMEYLYEVQCDDLIVNITFAWEGAIAIAQPSDTGALVSHRFPTYVFKRHAAIPEFFRYRILDKRFVYNLGVISPGGAGRNRVLNKNDFLNLRVFLPDVSEQRKIADCLVSLDELISAHSQKLDALKAHKRSLMQQLFPREGETLPHLRFPKFRDEGEWSTVPLSQVVEIASGQVDPTQPPYCDLPHVGGDNIESHTGNLLGVKTGRELRLVSGKYPFDETYLLYSKIRPALNKVAAPDFKGICSADIYPVRPANCRLRRDYLFYLLLSEEFLEYATRHSARSKIPKINRDALLAYAVAMPPPAEQQRIASCLTTIDELIAAQTQKLDALKTHKKGLMQQLFPTTNEVES